MDFLNKKPRKRIRGTSGGKCLPQAVIILFCGALFVWEVIKALGMLS